MILKCYEQQVKNELSPLDELFHRVGTYRTGPELRSLFEFIKQFPRMAPYNAFLLHVQRPGSWFVAGVHEWLSLYGRRIKPGANPLVILWPFGPVRFVYELNDTEGRPFPEELMEPFKVDGKVCSEMADKLLRNLPNVGVRLNWANHGTALAGSIQRAGQRYRVPYRGKFLRMDFDMVINSNLQKEAQIVTIAHELGHLLCGHLGWVRGDDTFSSRLDVERCVAEFEAESVAWLVCERIGISNPSEKYLAGYLDNDGQVPPISLEAVLKAAGIVENMLRGAQRPLKAFLEEAGGTKVAKG
jgi:hypothetical protein